MRGLATSGASRHAIAAAAAAMARVALQTSPDEEVSDDTSLEDKAYADFGASDPDVKKHSDIERAVDCIFQKDGSDSSITSETFCYSVEGRQQLVSRGGGGSSFITDGTVQCTSVADPFNCKSAALERDVNFVSKVRAKRRYAACSCGSWDWLDSRGCYCKECGAPWPAGNRGSADTCAGGEQKALIAGDQLRAIRGLLAKHSERPELARVFDTLESARKDFEAAKRELQDSEAGLHR